MPARAALMAAGGRRGVRWTVAILFAIAVAIYVGFILRGVLNA